MRLPHIIDLSMFPSLGIPMNHIMLSISLQIFLESLMLLPNGLNIPRPVTTTLRLLKETPLDQLLGLSESSYG